MQSGHVGQFAIVSEDAISKGIRRIVAVSGTEADKVRGYRGMGWGLCTVASRSKYDRKGHP